MRALALFLSASLVFGAPQGKGASGKKFEPDKVHISVTLSQRNGLAFPTAGGVALVAGPIFGGAAIAAALGGLQNLGTKMDQLMSGNEAGMPKTSGETARLLTSPEAEALISIASSLPFSSHSRRQIEADLVWDPNEKAYVVESGKMVWTGGNQSRFEAGNHLLYCSVQGGGTHALKRDELKVKFPQGDLSKAMAKKKDKDERLLYDLILDVHPKEEPINGEGGWIVEGGKIFQIKERYQGGGTSTDIKAVGGSDHVESSPLLYSPGISYSAEEREVGEGDAAFSETWISPGGTQEMISWTFKPPKDEEMIFDVSTEYDQWIPAPRPEDLSGVSISASEPAWKPLDVKVKIRTKREGGTPRKGKIHFTLEDISRNGGFAINYPQGGAGKADLRFAKEQPPGISLTGESSAETSEKVREATVRLESRDAGAFGKLRASCEDLDIKALHEPTNTYALYVPRDDDHNHLADAWEEKKGVKGLGASWDGAEVAGHATNGDGLALYEKYRGVVVSENGQKIWKRLEPRQKVLFFVDTSGIFLESAWKTGSGITAQRLTTDLVFAPKSPGASCLVNTNPSEVRNGGKYAVVVTTKDQGPAGEENTLGWTQGCPPAKVEFLQVFVGTHRRWIDNLMKNLRTALANPDSAEGKYFAEKCKLPRWLLEKALLQLQDPAEREKLAMQQIRSTALHEMGHACSLPGHNEGTSPPPGNKLCFMCYTTVERDWQFMVLQSLFKAGSLLPVQSGIFCRDADFNCWGHFDIKDN